MDTEQEAEMENLTATDIIVAVIALYGLAVVIPAMLYFLVAR